MMHLSFNARADRFVCFLSLSLFSFAEEVIACIMRANIKRRRTISLWITSLWCDEDEAGGANLS